MSYATVPATGPEAKISTESILYRLRNLVRRHLQGKENAMKSGAIMNRLGFRSGTTNRKLRQATKLLLQEENVPLVSGASGFYVAQTVEELNEYLENLEARRQGIDETVAAVRQIREKWLKRPKGDLFEW